MSETAKTNPRTADGHRTCELARLDQHPGQIGRIGNETRMVIHPT